MAESGFKFFQTPRGTRSAHCVVLPAPVPSNRSAPYSKYTLPLDWDFADAVYLYLNYFPPPFIYSFFSSLSIVSSGKTADTRPQRILGFRGTAALVKHRSYFDFKSRLHSLIVYDFT